MTSRRARGRARNSGVRWLAQLLLVCTLSLSPPLPALAQQPPHSEADYSRQPFVIERLHQDARYNDDGTGAFTLDARVRVQTEAGVHAFGELVLPYSSANQRLDVDSVRVHKVGGGVITAPLSAVQDVTAPLAREVPVYSDLRQKIVTVPGLRPGDTLDYHLTWTIHTALAPGQFWYAATFTRAAIVLDERLTVSVPRGRSLHVKTDSLAEPKVTEAGALRTYEWQYANLQVDTARKTPSLPGRLARQPPGVELSTFRTWEEVGRWYAGLERERETVTPELRAKADSLVRGRTSLRDSVSALYDYVANTVRYVSLSFGVGRYQPHAASEVLANQYGDCKDKHTLLASLLRGIGVASAPALISTERDVDPDMPSPKQFDHVITYIPARGDTIWLDATPAGAPFRFLLLPLRGKRTLVIPLEASPRLERTPAAPPFLTFQHAEVQGAVSDLGKLTDTVRFTLRGDEEVLIREAVLQIPPERWTTFMDRLAHQAGLRGTVSEPHAGDASATAQPFELSFQLEAPTSLTWKDERADLWLPVPHLDLPRLSDDTTAARDSIFLGLTREESVRLRLELPPSMTVRLPLPVAVSRDYGTYHSSYARDGPAVVVERVLHWERNVLPPDRAADVGAFARVVRDDESQVLQLTRAAGAPTVPTTASAAELYRAGLDALNAGDARAAVPLLRQAVTREPRHEWAWNDLGRAYMQAGELDSAIAAFQRQIAVSRYHQFAYNNLGLAQWRHAYYDDAVASFRKQIEVNPLDPYAHANLGRLDVVMHRDSDAAAELEKAARITPNNATLRVDLGKAYLSSGRADDATTEFGRAVEISPTPVTWNNVAYALAERGTKLDEAERYARSAIDATTAVLRGVTLNQVGRREALAVVGIGSYWDTLGWIYFQRGDLAAAERYVRAAWQLSHHGEVGDHLARIMERLGRKEEAIHTYALALNGTSPLPDTRGRLAALAGGWGAADRLAGAAGSELMALRTIHLATALKLDVATEVQVLLASGPRVEDVGFVGGPAAVHQLESGIRSATFPVSFPDSASIKLPRRGLLRCSSGTGTCSLVLFEPESIAPSGPATN